MGLVTKRPITILLVEDEPAIRDSVRAALQDQDIATFEFIEASSAEEGLDQARQHTPDVIVLDLHLPQKSGFDFMDILIRDERLSKISVIMLTGDDSLRNIFKAESKNISAFRFLGKPFNVQDLQSLVLEASGLFKKK